MKKFIFLSFIIFSSFFYTGCFSSEKEEKQQIEVSAAEIALNEKLSNEFNLISLSGNEIMEYSIASSSKNTRAALNSVYLLDSNNKTVKNLEANSNDFANAMVYEESRRIVDFDTKKAYLGYEVILSDSNSAITIFGEILITYEYEKEHWIEKSREFKNREISEAALSDNNNSVRASSFPSPFYRNLYYNQSVMMTGSDVKLLQTRLNEFFKERNINITLTADSYFGVQTKAAVMKFQQCYSSLVPDGIFGPATATVLMSVTDGNTLLPENSKLTIGTINYSTLPLKTNEKESLAVTIIKDKADTIQKSYYLKIIAKYSSSSLQIASGTIVYPANSTSSTFTYTVTFTSAGNVTTSVEIYDKPDGTLLTKRDSIYQDTVSSTETAEYIPAGYLFKTKVNIYSDRYREGKLYLYNKNGTYLHTSRAIGRSVSNGSQFVTNGNTPTGTYSGKLGERVWENPASYGPSNIIELFGLSGNALTAYNNGRSGIWIHGGRGSLSGYSGDVLYATYGCVRIPDPDQRTMFGSSTTERGLLGQNGVAIGGKGYVVVSEIN